MKPIHLLIFHLLFLSLPLLTHARTPPANEITIGSIQDLSGPAALLGIPTRDGMLMRIEEANASGGIHGRMIRLIIEDAGYDPKRGILAARKLLQRDHVFAFIATLGTPVVMATMPLITEAGALHLFPFSPHSSTYAPLHPLKFQIFPPYQDYMAAATHHMVKTQNYQRTCLLYQDDDYGLEVIKGIEAGLARLNQKLTAQTSYKRGATNLSSQISRLHAAQCDLIILATLVRETVTAITEARKVNWNVDMLVTASGYSAQVHELGGKMVEGLYGVSVLPHPYRTDASPMQLQWINRYRERFGTDPNVWSVMGYVLMDLFVRAAEKAGPELTTARFKTALETLPPENHFLGSPAYHFSSTNHLGNSQGQLAQIKNGQWKILTDFLENSSQTTP